MTLSLCRGEGRRLAYVIIAAAAFGSAHVQAQQHPQGHGTTTPVAQSAPVKAGDLVISEAWMRHPPDGARVAGGFLKITNNGKTSDRLIGGSAPFAKRFEVHEMAMADGVMKMRELPAGLEIKPGETVELKPGGYHVMFLDIAERPRGGALLKATLKFEKAGEISINIPVVGVGRSGAGTKTHH